MPVSESLRPVTSYGQWDFADGIKTALRKLCLKVCLSEREREREEKAGGGSLLAQGRTFDTGEVTLLP
jgi:hypothetical protein